MSDDSNDHWLGPDDARRITQTTFVERVDLYEQLTSTNTFAIEQIGESRIEPPHLIVARNQTAGRGRGRNPWWSGDGSLTFSLVLDAHRRELDVERWPLLALTTSLAICDTIDQLVPGCDLAVKWPNDVFLNGRKLSGILVEVPRTQAGLVVLGVGLNVNNSFAHAPAEIRSLASSLIDTTGYPVPVATVLDHFVRHLDDHLRRLSDNDPSLAARWQAMCLLTGCDIEVAVGAQSVRGRCLGIQTDGSLAIQTSDGEVRHCIAGVVVRRD